MDIKKLRSLLNREEGAKLDFKLKLDLDTESGRKEFAKDISAIANSRRGRGYIIIGIEDKTKKIIGIDEKVNLEEQLQQIVLSRLDPPVPISYESCDIDDLKVGIITVFTGENAPYQMRDNGVFYIRRGSTTDYMRKFELVSAFQEGSILDIEKTPILNGTLNMLNEKMLSEYFSEQGITITDENKFFLLRASSIITKVHTDTKYYLTFGGALIFGEFNKLLFPFNCIKISDNVNTFRIYGNLIEMYREAETILKKIVKKEYPLEPILNSLENAILYRDYGTYNKEINISLTENNVIIESPGLLLKDESYSKGYYLNRNLWIYEKYKTLIKKDKINDKLHGFAKIKYGFKNSSDVKFINDYANKIFRIILPGLGCV